MRWRSLAVLFLATSLMASAADPVPPLPVAAAPNSFIVLCYHETRDEVRDYPDPYAVDSAALVRQFAWLRGNGYTPVSLDAILASRQGGPALPAKAVLLTFDDAYRSFYTRVYPLLREFNFPAVLGVVGQWIDDPRGGAGLYGEKGTGTVTEASFPSWGQLREMADSGLVELASHTYDLHRGVPANPQGNLQPAATARIYDAATGTYESDASWRTRVRADLQRNGAAIEGGTGRRPRAVVWPYGSYNDDLVRMAAALGMPVALTLNDGPNTPDVPLNAVRRILVEHNPALIEFALEVRGPQYAQPLRVVQVGLDAVYSADPAEQERQLSVLLDRIAVLRPTHVWLRGTADNDGDGIADAAWFPNRHLPLRGDLFNRVAWQLASRTDVKVFAVMPVTGLRLSLAHIAEVYEDLARNAAFDGLVFDEPLRPGGVTVAFTQQLATRAGAFRAPLTTVRTLQPESPQAAEAYAAFAAAYDYVALVASAGRTDVPAADWLAALAAAVGQAPAGPDFRRKAVFMLRSSPPSVDRAVPDAVSRRLRALQSAGLLQFGYGPDDFLHDHPPLAQIAPVLSLRVAPAAAAEGRRP